MALAAEAAAAAGLIMMTPRRLAHEEVEQARDAPRQQEGAAGAQRDS